MQFELTKEFLQSLREALEAGNNEFIVGQMEQLHPADIAEILDELDVEEGKVILELSGDQAATVLTYLEEDEREDLLKSFSSREIAKKLIDNIDSDDAADLISELSNRRQEEVISHIEDAEQASDIVDLLHYPEGTAGAIMGKELIAVNENWSVLRCVREMRLQAEDVDFVYTVYVIDDHNKLLGLLSLKRLLLTPESTPISEIYKREGLISVRTTTPDEEVAQIMDKYDLVVLPVIDELGRLLGRITIDDVVDVMKEEADKDYQMASGHTQVVESTDSVWVLTKARLPWLLVGLLGGIFGAQVIGMYESDLHIYPEMAFFIPLIAAMGGNVGVQSSSIIVQGLANNTLGLDGMFSKLLKELSVGFFNGIVCAGLIFTYNLTFGDSMSLALTVSVALFAVIIFAALFGTFVPLVLDKYKIDPALATGPFITTANDILGLLMYFLIGRVMYGL